MDFQQRLDQWRAEAGVGVAAASVRVDGNLVRNGVSPDQPAPSALKATSESRFPIYSITKTFTAGDLCVASLDASGALCMNDPVTKWLDFLALPRAVTLCQLLRHTSGIPDYGTLPRYHDSLNQSPVAVDRR